MSIVRTRRLAAGLVVSFSLVTTAAAQQVPETRLAKADATFPVEFSSITGLLELPDGRVLMTDGIDQTLLRINLTTRKADTLGRVGQGPGEYKLPDAVFSLAGGRVLLTDLGNGRLSIFDGSGKYLESMPIARGAPGAGMTMVLPRATDAQGRIYFEARPMGMESGPPDSAFVVRFDPKRSTFDTLTKVGLPAVKVSTSGTANNRNVQMRALPLAAADAWNVAPDGRVAVARAVNYRLEWVVPGGRTVSGPANPARPVPVKDPDKKEWMAERANGLGIAVSNENGRMSVTFRRGGMRMGGQQDEMDSYQWPASKPAFVTGGVWTSPEGDAWVERSVAAGVGRRFDVFGADGKAKRQVVLPVGRRLAGLGKGGVVYLRHVTEEDLQILERYRL
ncbi:MAG: hypothetical protein AAB075_02430 [Gemmatimonadota bacterium]